MRHWIDTHLHLLYPERLSYEWAQGIPALNQAFHLEDYQVIAVELGIVKALHMEVDVHESQIQQETQLIDELKAKPNSLLAGAISSCRPEKEDIDQFIEASLRNPLIHGFRRVLHVVDDEISTTDIFRKNIQKLTCQGHPFDICVLPRQLHLADALAKACPQTQFVLDHCGVPAIASQDFAVWKVAIEKVASQSNVACKVSGLIAYGDVTRWTLQPVQSIAADLRPYVEHVIDCFGWNRLVWGSDYPVCNLTKGLVMWKAVTDQLLQGCSEAELDAIAHVNATRIYQLNTK